MSEISATERLLLPLPRSKDTWLPSLSPYLSKSVKKTIELAYSCFNLLAGVLLCFTIVCPILFLSTIKNPSSFRGQPRKKTFTKIDSGAIDPKDLPNKKETSPPFIYYQQELPLHIVNTLFEKKGSSPSTRAASLSTSLPIPRCLGVGLEHFLAAYLAPHCSEIYREFDLPISNGEPYYLKGRRKICYQPRPPVNLPALYKVAGIKEEVSEGVLLFPTHLDIYPLPEKEEHLRRFFAYHCTKKRRLPSLRTHSDAAISQALKSAFQKTQWTAREYSQGVPNKVKHLQQAKNQEFFQTTPEERQPVYIEFFYSLSPSSESKQSSGSKDANEYLRKEKVIENLADPVKFPEGFSSLSINEKDRIYRNRLIDWLIKYKFLTPSFISIEEATNLLHRHITPEGKERLDLEKTVRIGRRVFSLEVLCNLSLQRWRLALLQLHQMPTRYIYAFAAEREKQNNIFGEIPVTPRSRLLAAIEAVALYRLYKNPRTTFLFQKMHQLALKNFTEEDENIFTKVFAKGPVEVLRYTDFHNDKGMYNHDPFPVEEETPNLEVLLKLRSERERLKSLQPHQMPTLYIKESPTEKFALVECDLVNPCYKLPQDNPYAHFSTYPDVVNTNREDLFDNCHPICGLDFSTFEEEKQREEKKE